MTKAFNFSLQKVLNVRGMLEDAKAVELKKAQAVTEIGKQKLEQIRATKQALLNEDTDGSGDQPTTLQDLNNRRAYAEQLTEDIKIQGEAVAQSEMDTEEQRIAYVEASKDKMVIEKLKEHHQESFRKKMNQEQVKEESEVASRVVHKAGRK